MEPSQRQTSSQNEPDSRDLDNGATKDPLSERAHRNPGSRPDAKKSEVAKPLTSDGPASEAIRSGAVSGLSETGHAEIDAAWDSLPRFEPALRHLEQNRIITATRKDPAHTAFDVLRTRLLQALREKGWTRVAITSPSKACGKSFTAANLAISLSRQESCRTMLFDFDMRRPSLHRILGASSPKPIGDLLRGTVDPEDRLVKLGRNAFDAGHGIAFGFSNEIEPYASELLQLPRTVQSLDRIEAAFAPDIMLFDLPPALYYDDVIAFRPQFDGVLLVLGGGITTAKEVKEVRRRLGEDTPLLGTVLNRAELTDHRKYSY